MGHTCTHMSMLMHARACGGAKHPFQQGPAVLEAYLPRRPTNIRPPVQTRLSCVKPPSHPSPPPPSPARSSWTQPCPRTPQPRSFCTVAHRGKHVTPFPPTPGPRPRPATLCTPPNSQWSRQKPTLWFYSQSAGHSGQSGCCCHQWLGLMERLCPACCCLDSVLAVAAVVAAPENQLPQGRLALVAGLPLCCPELGVGCCCAGSVCRQPGRQAATATALTQQSVRMRRAAAAETPVTVCQHAATNTTGLVRSTNPQSLLLLLPALPTCCGVLELGRAQHDAQPAPRPGQATGVVVERHLGADVVDDLQQCTHKGIQQQSLYRCAVACCVSTTTRREIAASPGTVAATSPVLTDRQTDR